MTTDKALDAINQLESRPDKSLDTSIQEVVKEAGWTTGGTVEFSPRDSGEAPTEKVKVELWDNSAPMSDEAIIELIAKEVACESGYEWKKCHASTRLRFLRRAHRIAALSKGAVMKELDEFWKREEAVYKKTQSSYNEGFVDAIEECKQLVRKHAVLQPDDIAIGVHPCVNIPSSMPPAKSDDKMVVEHVAREMYNANFGKRNYDWQNEGTKEAFREYAKAAIAAINEQGE
jgi:hypothetical protein